MKIRQLRTLSFLFLIGMLTFELIWTFILIPHFKSITPDGKMIDMMIGYDAKTINPVLASYGYEGITYYKFLQIIDLFFPLVYSGFLFFSALFLLRINKIQNKIILSYFKTIALLPALFDYFENYFIHRMLVGFPNDITHLIPYSNFMTLMKFIFFCLGFVNLFFLVGRVIQNKLVKFS